MQQVIRTSLFCSLATSLLVLRCHPLLAQAPYLKSKDKAVEERLPQSQNAGVAVLKPTQGNEVKGTLKLRQMGNKVHVAGTITGLSPGKHGFHVHEFGDCSAADATSAGGHFAPHDSKHGAPEDEQRHVGDLGNIVANEKGIAEIDITDSQISLSGEQSILGRAFIVHKDADTFVQPTGDAGSRLACGVIGLDGQAAGATATG